MSLAINGNAEDFKILGKFLTVFIFFINNTDPAG